MNDGIQQRRGNTKIRKLQYRPIITYTSQGLGIQINVY